MAARTVELILVPYDGERAGAGAARAPQALLAHGFADRLRELGAAVHLTEVARPEDLDDRGEAAKAAAVGEVGRRVARAVAIAHSRQRFAVIVSGGCLTALGAVTGLQRSGRELE